ncbi:MAG: HD domain-containing protein [Candidatus Promineifilaceae bacterium]|nr:HD domain-containing protein [Candidatus Promineifilaceae bacterium]
MTRAEPEETRPAWRKSVREAMYQAALDEAERQVEDGAPSFRYRWEHVKAVHTLALRLAKLTGADEEVVEAAAWLHDVAKEAGSDHPQEGAAFARRFLPETDFPSEKVEAVARAIEEHRGLWRDEPLQELASQVLWDADKLSKLGLTAAFHWTGLNLTKGDDLTTPLTTQELIERGRDADWQEKTVSSMHTAPAQRAAQARLAAFNALWNALEAELNAADLEAVQEAERDDSRG